MFIEGKAQIINEDFWGNITILSEVGQGDIFGEAHSLLPYDTPTVSVVSLTSSTVIFLDIECIQTPIPEIFDCQGRLRSNLLLSYFTEQMNKHQSSSFDIPFTRQQLADYLSVDRSAMSSELSKMQKDGLIRYNLNHFELIPYEDYLS